MLTQIEQTQPAELWEYYQRGYKSLLRSGKYFRDVLRPALTEVLFLRAMPLLKEYLRANHGDAQLPPEFGDQLQACTLTPRDLIHLDYAISLGFRSGVGHDPVSIMVQPMVDWPGPGPDQTIMLVSPSWSTQRLNAGPRDADGDDDDDEDEPTTRFNL